MFPVLGIGGKMLWRCAASQAVWICLIDEPMRLHSQPASEACDADLSKWEGRGLHGVPELYSFICIHGLGKQLLALR